MKAVGVIAEYNPFHNGHLYQINIIKEKYPNHAIIVVMTGNFTERGDVAIIDKWKRTEIALKNGIDLVIELPFPFATQSADFFAYGAITILEYLKVEKVIFGSENDNIEDLTTIAQAQLNNKEFDQLVKIYLKMGNNYPTALSYALADLTGKKITTPNDLLGISYIKTILQKKYKIIPETIQRENNYHSKKIQSHIASASAIRDALKKKQNIKNQIPNNALKYMNDLHFLDDYYPLLKYKILTEEDLSKYQNMEEGIDKKIKKEILNSNSIEELIKNIKSKRYTYNKIQRILLHILCNFTKERSTQFQKITYLRILGLNKKGSMYLNQYKKEIQIPIISKITREKDPMLEFELQTTQIYEINNPKESIKKECQKIIFEGEEL